NPEPEPGTPNPEPRTSLPLSESGLEVSGSAHSPVKIVGPRLAPHPAAGMSEFGMNARFQGPDAGLG
ncbi:MAG: hypothetical protein V7647_2643, partial [Acidobacteriota bacterium]